MSISSSRTLPSFAAAYLTCTRRSSLTDSLLEGPAGGGSTAHAVRRTDGKGTKSSRQKRLGRGPRVPVNLIKEWLGHRTGRLALALGIYALLFILWVAFGATRLPYREAIGDLAFPPLGIIAAVLTWRVGSQRSLQPRPRFARGPTAPAMFSYPVGGLLRGSSQLVLGPTAVPSLARTRYP